MKENFEYTDIFCGGILETLVHMVEFSICGIFYIPTTKKHVFFDCYSLLFPLAQIKASPCATDEQ